MTRPAQVAARPWSRRDSADDRVGTRRRAEARQSPRRRGRDSFHVICGRPTVRQRQDFDDYVSRRISHSCNGALGSIMYALLRALAGVALRWFYRSIQVDGRERIPRRGPVLFVVNHPNALVDAMLVGWAVPRRVLLTAKATIFGNPFGAMLLRWVDVVPLRRASDEKTVREPLDPSRNEDTFLAVRTAFQAGRAVLIFPEGKSHDEPAMAPLRTGAARMALDAWNSGAAPMLSIVPVGLTFERKDTPRTRVLVQVGEPLRLERWCDVQHARPVEELTAEIDARLRVVTRNYASADEAARVVRLAS